MVEGDDEFKAERFLIEGGGGGMLGPEQRGFTAAGEGDLQRGRAGMEFRAKGTHNREAGGGGSQEKGFHNSWVSLCTRVSLNKSFSTRAPRRPNPNEELTGEAFTADGF
jgi:hypothetical protein